MRKYFSYPSRNGKILRITPYDQMKGDITMDGKLCISVEEMGKRLGIGRVSAYDLAHSEGFPVFRVGASRRKLLVSVRGLEEWVARQAGNFQIEQTA